MSQCGQDGAFILSLFTRTENSFGIVMCYHTRIFRLTLLLSCAMNFHKYPHDEQLCKMSMESCKYYFFLLIYNLYPSPNKLKTLSSFNFEILCVYVYLCHYAIPVLEGHQALYFN